MTNPLPQFLTEVEEKLKAARMSVLARHHVPVAEIPPGETTFSQLTVLTRAIPLHQSAETYLKRLVEICRMQDEALNDMYDSACLSPTSTPSKSAFMKTIKSRQRVAEMLRTTDER